MSENPRPRRVVVVPHEAAVRTYSLLERRLELLGSRQDRRPVVSTFHRLMHGPRVVDRNQARCGRGHEGGRDEDVRYVIAKGAISSVVVVDDCRPAVALAESYNLR